MYIVKSRMTGKYSLPTLKSNAKESAQAFVDYRRELSRTNYDWKYYSREYKTVRVEIKEI